MLNLLDFIKLNRASRLCNYTVVSKIFIHNLKEEKICIFYIYEIEIPVVLATELLDHHLYPEPLDSRPLNTNQTFVLQITCEWRPNNLVS